MYIEDVKIGVGKTENEAVSALDGYTILADEGENVDRGIYQSGGVALTRTRYARTRRLRSAWIRTS